MPVKMDEQLMKSAYDVIKENATPMESRYNPEKPETITYKYHTRNAVTQTVYQKFLKANGITADTIDKIISIEQAWNSASAKYAKEKLGESVHEALKDKAFMEAAGPRYLKSTVFTTVKDGKRAVIVTGYSENRNPRATGEDDAITTSYGSITVHHKITKDFAPEFVEEIRNDVEKMLKGKF